MGLLSRGSASTGLRIRSTAIRAWRQIAEINGIDNPMDLRGGQLLLLPDLQ